MEIPDPISKDLQKGGGIEGLRRSSPADEDVKKAVKTFRVLSDPIRVRILRLLQIQPLCPCILAEVMDVANSRLSYHLSALQEVGLVIGEQRGRWIIYDISPSGKRALHATWVMVGRESQND